ncbi:MAG: winged helix-turn-helix domain-containing protein, partial [Candidatus Eremiobacteraeota bacterium]|nr:winged helix-turn-helix domain-containing protein [Candidatus Eremiobacteraeota bacterium]
DSADLSHDDRFIRSQVKHLGFHSYVCVPIPGLERAAGCIEAGSRETSEALLKQWLTVTREAERLGLLLDRERMNPPSAETSADGGRRLELRTLGGFEARRSGVALSIDSFARRRAVTLLKILLTNYGKVVVRDELVDLLWPSEPPKDGAQLLKIVVHYLRRGLGEAENGATENSFIVTEPNGYRFNTASQHTLDAIEFEARAEEGFHFERRGRWREALVALQAAAALYDGDYLEDEPYSDWCVTRRRQLREKLFEVLLTKARLLRTAGDFEPAIRVYRRILDLDPCLEDVHRDLMEVLHFSGKRSQALRQFEACRRALQEEFDVAPVMETETLYRRILAGGN